MPTLGVDCHLILQHPSVNGGVAYGFIAADNDDLGPAISLQREAFDPANDGTYTDNRRKWFFTAVCADEVHNPDGSDHTPTRAADYAMLISFLGQRSAITLTTPEGVFGSLKATTHYATEIQYGGVSYITCQLNDAGNQMAPADPTRYAQSVFVDDNTYVGAMNIGNSYFVN